MSETFMSVIPVSELIKEVVFYFYLGNIVAALISYVPQQRILISMIRGQRQVSDDISATTYWIWCATYLIGTFYSILIIQNDLPLIILSVVNLLHTLFSALLSSYVHYLYRRKIA